MLILSLFPHYLHSRDVTVCFVHWSLLAITGSGKVFSEEHMLLHVSVFAQPGSGWVASTGECSRSPNLHYWESKEHNRVCSFHPSNGTQASFLLFSIFLCLLERLIYQYHTLKRLLWETSVTDHRWEEERHSTSCGGCQRCTEVSTQLWGRSSSLRDTLHRKQTWHVGFGKMFFWEQAFHHHWSRAFFMPWVKV